MEDEDRRCNVSYMFKFHSEKSIITKTRIPEKKNSEKRIEIVTLKNGDSHREGKLYRTPNKCKICIPKRKHSDDTEPTIKQDFQR